MSKVCWGPGPGKNSTKERSHYLIPERLEPWTSWSSQDDCRSACGRPVQHVTPAASLSKQNELMDCPRGAATPRATPVSKTPKAPRTREVLV